MSNYISENLISIPSSAVPAGTLAIKIGNDVFLAGSASTGKSMDFYKCSSVETSNSTWTGHLASVSDSTGIWYFASDSTSGLPFDRITPVVGGVYDASCTFQVKNYNTGIPEQGLIFYLPLDEDPGSTDKKGNALSFRGSSNIIYGQTVQGISCAQFGYDAGILGPDFYSILPNNPNTQFTISAWVSLPDVMACIGIGDRNATSKAYDGLRMQNGNWQVHAGRDSSEAFHITAPTGFQHILMTFANSVVKLYVNNTLSGQGSYYNSSGNPFNNMSMYKPNLYFGTDSGVDPSYVAAFRIYNRMLDSTQISALASEFSPSAS